MKGDQPRKDVAVFVLIDSEGRFLMEWREDFCPPGAWVFPGGKREGTELLAMTVVREAHEELGIEVLAMQPLVEVPRLYQAVEEAGVTSTQQALGATFEQFFAGWAATPDDSALALTAGSGVWWEVLGIGSAPTPAEVRNAYLALARIHHPDVGGEAAAFNQLRVAYDAGMKATGG